MPPGLLSTQPVFSSFFCIPSIYGPLWLQKTSSLAAAVPALLPRRHHHSLSFHTFPNSSCHLRPTSLWRTCCAASYSHRESSRFTDSSRAAQRLRNPLRFIPSFRARSECVGECFPVPLHDRQTTLSFFTIADPRPRQVRHTRGCISISSSACIANRLYIVFGSAQRHFSCSASW